MEGDPSGGGAGGAEARGAEASRPRSLRLDSWEAIIAQLRLLRSAEGEGERIELLIELLVNLRLLGTDAYFPDRRSATGDIERRYAEIERETRLSIDAATEPSSTFIYYAREVLKKLPLRRGAEDIIEQIRAAAEEFEEGRSEDDPLRGFAGDLRKEVHRRLSPRIIGAYLEPYLALALRGETEPMARAGYVALPSRFSAEEEDPAFVELAEELLELLDYLWDYEKGNLAAVKAQLRQGLPVFERCFLKAEVQGLVELLCPERLGRPETVLDLLKRLASIKRDLKDSLREGRIGLYDLLLLDLSLGRLIFLLANDLTNNHYAELGPRNAREALEVVRELLNISSVKGLAIREAERYRLELEGLVAASAFDFLRAKRCLGAICGELQRYLQSDIIDAMSGILLRVLEDYELPTSALSAVKTRFFNNFIRRTQIHVLSEFAEKLAAEVDRELGRQDEEGRLYAGFGGDGEPPRLEPRAYVAATWREPDPRARPAFGGKGNGILDMAALGLRVPPAFVLGYPLFAGCGPEGELGPSLVALVRGELEELERRTGRRLGDPSRPLIVSVRSGAPRSMPGVMATILNVGLSPEVRSALDARRGESLTGVLYRRFLENSLAALTLLPGRAGSRAAASGGARGAAEGADPGAASGAASGAAPEKAPAEARPRELAELEAELAAELGEDFLRDPRVQLAESIRLVYGSRGSQAVRDYSQSLASELQAETAVTVQQLVFGNLNERSLSGALMTRNPITGKDELFGEFKRRAQGEEVVMGSASTEPIAEIEEGLGRELEVCKELLVGHYRQDLDLEFTVEDGKLYLLQARAARLGAFASLVADTEFLERGIIDLETYRARLERLEIAHACVALPRADFRSRRWDPPLCLGVPINGGVVSGSLVLSLERLKEAEQRRESVVFLAASTKPTDFAVMSGAQAIVTVNPGRTSHAAITAMSMNKTCIVGCGEVEIDYPGRSVLFRGPRPRRLREGERVTADGNTGAVYAGAAPISEFFLPIAELGAAAAGADSPKAAAAAVSRLIDSRLAGLGKESKLRRKTLEEAGEIGGRRILLRVDANARLGGAEAGEGGSRGAAALAKRRILGLIPPLRSMLERGATPVVCSHLGDPGSPADAGRSREEVYRDYSLEPVAALLAAELGSSFVFHEASVGASGLLLTRKDIEPGKVNLLENLRFATGEKDNDEAFARSLAELSDGYYVNDAFNVCQRRHASITGVPRFAARRLAGPRLAAELACLETLLREPPRPFFALFGDEGLEARFGAVAALLARVDGLAIVGSPDSPASGQAEGPEAGEGGAGAAILAALEAANPGKLLRARSGSEGGEALSRILDGLEGAATLLWAGPAASLAGGWRPEVSGEGLGPLEAALCRALERRALVVLCSEETRELESPEASACHATSGPGAFLEYLERLSLPGITALDPA